MNSIAVNIASGAIVLCIIAAPAYLIILGRRFWLAVIICWLFLIMDAKLSVIAWMVVHPVGVPPNTTSVGLTTFSGWIIALPWCGILLLIRFMLVKFKVIRPDSSKMPLEQGKAAKP